MVWKRGHSTAPAIITVRKRKKRQVLFLFVFSSRKVYVVFIVHGHLILTATTDDSIREWQEGVEGL